MEFKIHFNSGQATKSAVDISHRPVGLDKLDKAREEAGCPFDASRMDGWTNFLALNPIIAVSEEAARESGHFKDTHTAHIVCATAALNEFVDEKLSVVRTDNGEVTEAKWLHEFNAEKFLAAWKERGFPLEW